MRDWIERRTVKRLLLISQYFGGGFDHRDHCVFDNLFNDLLCPYLRYL